MTGIVRGGKRRWAERVEDGGGWLIHCVPAEPKDSHDVPPPMYSAEAAAFAEMTEVREQPAQPADWSKDL